MKHVDRGKFKEQWHHEIETYRDREEKTSFEKSGNIFDTQILMNTSIRDVFFEKKEELS